MNEDEAKISALRSDSSMRFVMISHSIFRLQPRKIQTGYLLTGLGHFA